MNVNGTTVRVIKFNNTEYICITDIARIKNQYEPKDVVKNWLRSKNTLQFLGLWEKLNNPTFKGVELDPLMVEAGTNAFTMSPSRWIELTGAIGVVTKIGSNGGTFAHKDIAFEFSSWVRAEFKLYLLKEFQRLKEDEQKLLGWSVKRKLSKINYHIHTDAIKQNLLPAELTQQQVSVVYANEAVVLNMALFGITAKQWRDTNPGLTGNMRDYASINKLICLSNLENINAVFINENISQKNRLLKLNQIAIQQMKVLQDVENRRMIK